MDLLSLPTSRISKDIYNQGVRYEELDWISRHDCSNYFVSDRGCGEEKKSGSTDMSHSSETKAKQLTGQLMHIEGWHYTIKDSTGQEMSFAVTARTNLLSTVKEGDYVVAMIGDENTATSIKNVKNKE